MNLLLSNNDKEIIIKLAKKYELKRVILFGSSKDKLDSNDIDLAVEGLDPRVFFKFYWELYRDLSKPVDLIDLTVDCLFNELIKEEGLVIYG